MRNLTTSFRRTLGAIFLSLVVISLLPVRALAEEQTVGTIVVSVVDESGDTMSGDWYLHHGNSESGFLVRNGSFGETFEMENGYYYLEVRGKAPKHPFVLVHSANPQFLNGGSSITFNVQYFETQEQLLTATGHPPVVQDTEVVGATGQQQSDIFDVHGCNSSQGYAWCAKDQLCTKYWTPNCRVTTSGAVADTNNEAAVEPEVTEEPVVATVPAVTEESVSSNSDVPTFEMAPAPTTPQDLNVAIEADSGMRLVQTGGSAGLLLIASMLLSLGIVRRSYTRRQRP